MNSIIIDREQSNLGGINYALYFALNEIESFGDIINNSIAEIKLANEAQAALLEFTPETANFNEEQLGRNLFSYEFSISVPKDYADRGNILRSLDNKKLAVLCTDNNGNTRLLGLPNNGCILTRKFNSGTAVPDKNAYTLTFTWLSRIIAPYANNLIFLTIPPSIILQNGGYLKLQNGGYLILQ